MGISSSHTSNDGYFDLKSLSGYSRLSIPCLREYIKEGLLPAYKVKGKILVKRSEFDAWMQGYRLKDISVVVDEVMESLK